MRPFDFQLRYHTAFGRRCVSNMLDEPWPGPDCNASLALRELHRHLLQMPLLSQSQRKRTLVSFSFQPPSIAIHCIRLTRRVTIFAVASEIHMHRSHSSDRASSPKSTKTFARPHLWPAADSVRSLSLAPRLPYMKLATHRPDFVAGARCRSWPYGDFTR